MSFIQYGESARFLNEVASRLRQIKENICILNGFYTSEKIGKDCNNNDVIVTNAFRTVPDPDSVQRVQICNTEGEELYTTGFATQILTDDVTPLVFPANLKEIVIFNNTDCVYTLTTNKGAQSIMPFGTISLSINDNETALTFTSFVIVSGVFGVSQNIIVNYRTSAI